MFSCTLNTQNIENNPIWTCQAEPDNYSWETISDTTEDQLTPADVKDPVLATFLKIIIKKSKVESFEIKAVTVINKWPDEFGATRTIKKLSGKKTPEHSEHLKEKNLTLEMCYGPPIDIKAYWQPIVDSFYSLRGSHQITSLSLKIFERLDK